MAIFVSFDVARLSFNPKSSTVTGGYVQTDSLQEGNKFDDAGEEEWAERVIWSKFKEPNRKRPPKNRCNQLFGQNRIQPRRQRD
jgi:hypothetical protein